MSNSASFAFPGIAVGQLLSASVSCPSGVVLGGGARVTTTGTDALEQFIALRSSYPSAASTWTAVAVVTGLPLVGSGSVTVTSYALCSQ